MADSVPSCELCRDAGGRVLWSDGQCRLVRIDDPDYPGYCRVIWNRHRSEMTDLAPAEQRHLMMVVLAAEAALRACLQPDKINLASLGNMTPHLHWHIIPRWRDDRHFPQPIWAAPQREAAARPDVADAVLRSRFVAALAEEQGG